MVNLSDPTAELIKRLRKDARKRGNRIAKEHFSGDMAVVAGEVFGDMLAAGVLENIGNSLYDVPMEVIE